MAQDLKEAVKDIQKIQKSLGTQLGHAEKSVKQSDDELAAQEEANKHAVDAKASDENEKAAKKDKEVDEAEKCGDTDEAVEPAKKSVKKDDDETDDGDEEATGSEEEKSINKDDDDATGDTDVAEESKKPAKNNVKKDTDGKVEEAKAKQAKDLNNVEDVKGHEEASKSMIDAINVLTKAVNTMVETNKSYNRLLSDVDVLVKSYNPVEEKAKKSAVKSTKKDTKIVDDSESGEKCGDGEVEESAKKAKKSENAEKCDESAKEEKCDSEAPKAKKPAEETNDQAEKSMPVGQAVYSGEDQVEKSAKETPAEDVVLAGDLKNVLRKSITAFSGSELPENMVKVNAMKSLYRSVENTDDKEVVKKSLVDEYNRI